jgi:uncharacterized RDD family membrane protein YckC
MSNLWFYAQNNEQHGPLTAEALRELLGTELPASTMVWSEGMESWVEASKVEELVGVTPPPPLQPRLIVPQAEPVVGTAEGFRGSGSAVGSRPRPASVVPPHAGAAQQRSRQAWARFLARSADIFLAYWILSLPFGEEILYSQMSALYGPLILLAIVPLEAWCLSRWGMTPGKWLFRVRVVHTENRFLTFEEGLRRTFKVMLSGMALGIMLLQVLFNILAYKELLETGSTVWDRTYKTEVQHGTRSPMHTGLAIGAAIMFMVWVSSMSLGQAV